MKIDIFCHITPPKFFAALEKSILPRIYNDLPYKYLPSLLDLDTRFRVMDNYKDMVQVLTLASPPIESITEPAVTIELSKIANNELAELVARYPDRFVGAVACLPMNDMDAALNELERAVNQLHLKGVQINTRIMGKPLNYYEFMPLYQKMSQYQLPIWIHPFFQPTKPILEDSPRPKETRISDAQSELASSADEALQMTYQTPAAMTSLIYGQIFDTYPTIKFIAHHCGSTVPYYANRIEFSYSHNIYKARDGFKDNFPRPILDYYKSFYADTALHGNVSALMCGLSFFGVEHLLFGTDMPFDGDLGLWTVRQTIESVEQMKITEPERAKIFEGNARSLLRLS